MLSLDWSACSGRVMAANDLELEPAHLASKENIEERKNNKKRWKLKDVLKKRALLAFWLWGELNAEDRSPATFNCPGFLLPSRAQLTKSSKKLIENGRSTSTKKKKRLVFSRPIELESRCVLTLEGLADCRNFSLRERTESPKNKELRFLAEKTLFSIFACSSLAARRVWTMRCVLNHLEKKLKKGLSYNVLLRTFSMSRTWNKTFIFTITVEAQSLNKFFFFFSIYYYIFSSSGEDIWKNVLHLCSEWATPGAAPTRFDAEPTFLANVWYPWKLHDFIFNSSTRPEVLRFILVDFVSLFLYKLLYFQILKAVWKRQTWKQAVRVLPGLLILDSSA